MKIPTNEKSVKTKIKNGSAHSGFHISNRNYEEAFLEINMKKYSTIIFAMDLSDLHETKAYITIVRRTYY